MEKTSQRNNWLVLFKKYRRHPIALLPAACVAMAVFVGLISYALLVGQKQGFAYVQPKPSAEAFIQLEETVKNMTTQIFKLEEADRRQKDRINQLEVVHKQYQATISELQVQLVQLEREGSELEGDIQQVNRTLDTKADQQDVNENTNTITTLRETTVRREEFQGLVTTVGSKAERSDLNKLEDTVTHLRQTTATKSELNSLSERVTNHITSSQNEHNQLTSRIDDNDRDIQSVKDRIGNAESDIKELDSAACKKILWWKC